MDRKGPCCRETVKRRHAIAPDPSPPGIRPPLHRPRGTVLLIELFHCSCLSSPYSVIDLDADSVGDLALDLTPDLATDLVPDLIPDLDPDSAAA